MADVKIKFKLKGHESFQIREGWLRKGIKAIENDRKIFLSNEATDILGVGTNMVKAIRYWLQACGLTYEKVVQGSKREQYLTEDFGEIINKYDPYFEDIYTWWLIHYKLATNKDLSTSWYLFFNEFNLVEFNKEQMLYSLDLALKRFSNNNAFSKKTLADDCDCIIKSYQIDKSIESNPEDNIVCPLSQLGLIETLRNNISYSYIKLKPNIDILDKMVVLYIILDNLGESNSTSIDKLLNDKCNVGKVLNLDRNILNEYLDILKNYNYIQVNRTAGLDKIYIKNVNKVEVLEKYYKQQ